MVWQKEKEFIVKVSVTTKNRGDPSCIDDAFRMAENKIRAVTIKHPGVSLRVTVTERTSDPSTESHRKRVRTFVERFR
jgi:hypothetical protein